MRGVQIQTIVAQERTSQSLTFFCASASRGRVFATCAGECETEVVLLSGPS